MRHKVAVIGSGAAAFGVLTALLNERRDVEITLFDIGRRVRDVPPALGLSRESIEAFYNKIYSEIRLRHPFKFPPPKTHFGQQLPRQAASNGWNVFKSDALGGLTNYWSGAVFPFTPRELSKWPFSSDTLCPYYRQIADRIGITGGCDALNEYYTEDFANRPAIRMTTAISRLNDFVNQRRGQDEASYRILSGECRSAIETRQEQPNSCVYCGECAAGCFRGSIYSTRGTMEEILQHSRGIRYVQGRVTRIDNQNRTIYAETDKGEIRASGFSKVFLCAGCLASTEIMMRSIGLQEGPVMTDNAVYDFPILYTGKLSRDAGDEPYMALANLILMCVPKDTSRHTALCQIHPNFDYLWRYNVPPGLWPVLRPIVSFFRKRVLWVRLYLHSDHSHAYAIKLKNENVTLEVERRDQDRSYVSELMRSIRNTINRGPFYVPPIFPIRETTNSHYGGTLPYGGPLLNVPANNEVYPGIYLCDSSCFPESPAIPLTFTIMANALRIATEAFRD